MLKYPCLVLDHDDTVVRTEETINYPCFCQYLAQYFPGYTLTLEQYIHGCYSLGFVQMCRQWFSFSEAQCRHEYDYWQHYIAHHMPQVYPGVGPLLRMQKDRGGKIIVVSHSNREVIQRDYLHHFGILPDAVYGWDLPEAQRKPSPYPVLDVMERFGYTREQILVVDDMTPGWEMARTAGVKIAFSAWGRQNYPQILLDMGGRCDFTFHNAAQLQSFLFQEDL